MVRLHVFTGDVRYRRYYEELLAIRAGKAPRPRNYDPAFWDRVLAEGKRGVTYGAPQSLRALMVKAHFTPREFDALDPALRTSNALATIEGDVMRRVAARIAEGVDRDYARDVLPQARRLLDAPYLREKRRIMEAIERFRGMVNARTTREADAARRRATSSCWQRRSRILVLIVLAGAAGCFMLGRLAVRPLGQLIAATRDIAGGNYARRAEIRAAAELEQLATDFNAMSSAIERDIARREEAQAQAAEAREIAEHASRAKSAFLAAMSHEIRTPMIGVMGMLEVLARTDLDEHQRTMLATSKSSAQSLITIIGDVLDFSKIEAGKLEIDPCTIALPELIEAAVGNFVHTASAKGLLLNAEIDPRLAPAVVADPVRLRQILSNFLSNAVKFTEVGGIEVTATVLDESPGRQLVELAVRDTGVGVSEEVRRELFQPFAQAAPGTTRRFGGTGLGLVICRRLAELMSGEITMDSTPGVGTTMRLVVPLEIGDRAAVEAIERDDDARAPLARALPSVEEAEREGSLLLLAEDHPVNRTVLVSQLHAAGFAVETAEDGQEAIELFAGGRYALVLSDLNMPRMDGYGLVAAIRALEAREGLPPHAGHRAVGERHAGRSRALQRGRHGRLHRQADDDPVPGLQAAPLAAAPRVAADRADRRGTRAGGCDGRRARRRRAERADRRRHAPGGRGARRLRQRVALGPREPARRLRERRRGRAATPGAPHQRCEQDGRRASRCATSPAASSARPAPTIPTGSCSARCSTRSPTRWSASPPPPRAGASAHARDGSGQGRAELVLRTAPAHRIGEPCVASSLPPTMAGTSSSARDRDRRSRLLAPGATAFSARPARSSSSSSRRRTTRLAACGLFARFASLPVWRA